MERNIKLETQVDAVVYFIQKLDIDMIDDILDPSKSYQNFEKPIFIHKLGIAFSKFIELGNNFLETSKGFCDSEICNYKCSGYSFVGNNSGHYLNLIIDVKNDLIRDIYECSEFSLSEDGKKFRNSKRIEIDNFDF